MGSLDAILVDLRFWSGSESGEGEFNSNSFQ